MMKAGGDMALLGGRIAPSCQRRARRRPAGRGMGPLGRELLVSLLDELARLRPQ